MSIGAFVLATSLAVISRATELWQVGVLFGGGCAVGMAMLGPMASSTAMANWFDRLRGRALGIANAGGPLGPALIVPIAALAIGEFGWRSTMSAFAGLTLLVALPAIRFGMIDRPSLVGQYPDGEKPAQVVEGAPGEAVESSVWDTPEVLRSRDFWFVALGVAPFAGAGLILGANAIPFMMHLGASTESAAVVVFVQSCGAVSGPLLFGTLADRIDPRGLFIGLIATISLALGALALDPIYPIALVLFGVVGLAAGSMMPLYGALIGRLFGRESFGQVIGLGALVGLPILFVGPLGFGFAFDATESYSVGLLGLIVALVLGAGLLAFLPQGSARRSSTAGATGG